MRRPIRNPALKRPGKHCSPRRDALRRLKLVAVPPIDPLAVQAVRAAGSKRTFIEYARGSEDEAVKVLVGLWDGLSPSDRRALSVTDLCAATGLKFSRLLGEIAAAAFDHNTDVSKLMAAVSQPRVVKATIDSAIRYLGPDGVKDRQMLHAHSNFLPVPKGASTIVRLQQQINNTSVAQEGDQPMSLPSFESDIIAFNAAQRNKHVPAATDKGNQPGGHGAEATE